MKQKLEAKQVELSGELDTLKEKLQASVNKNSQDDKVIQYLSRVYYVKTLSIFFETNLSRIVQ